MEDEQAGFGSQMNAYEQILNLRLLAEKHLEHQKELFRNFVDLEKLLTFLIAANENVHRRVLEMAQITQIFQGLGEH